MLIDCSLSRYAKALRCTWMISLTGRRVDVIGRSIPGAKPGDPVGSLRNYLETGQTESSRLLAKKAVVLIEPITLLGTIVWLPE